MRTLQTVEMNEVNGGSIAGLIAGAIIADMLLPNRYYVEPVVYVETTYPGYYSSYPSYTTYGYTYDVYTPVYGGYVVDTYYAW